MKRYKVSPDGSRPHSDRAREVTLIPGDGVGPEVIGAAVSVLEATGVKLKWDRQLAGAAGIKRYGSPADFYECTDGLVRISAMEDHQWQGLIEAMASPAWAERFATVADHANTRTTPAHVTKLLGADNAWAAT